MTKNSRSFVDLEVLVKLFKCTECSEGKWQELVDDLKLYLNDGLDKKKAAELLERAVKVCPQSKIRHFFAEALAEYEIPGFTEI